MGFLLGIGTDKQNVRLFDYQAAGKEVANFSHADSSSSTGSVSSISFNENGFLMASATEKVVKIWDLRKLKCFKRIESSNPMFITRFDASGGYLAIGSTSLKVCCVKQDYLIARDFDLPANKSCRSVCFGLDSAFIALGGSDNKLRIFS